jgi:hypothetical protein
MLKLKLSNHPPAHACLLGYYNGTRFDVNSNLGFSNTSWETVANRTGYRNQTRVHRTGTPHDPVTYGGVVVGNVSVRRRNLVDPVPLPWGFQLGRTTPFRAEALVYNPLADQYDPSDTLEAEFAAAEIKRGIEIIDLNGEVATDVMWDIALVPDVSVPDDGKVLIGTSFGWRTFLYVDRVMDSDRPLLVRYTAIDPSVTGPEPSILYNYEELVVSQPYLNGSITEPNSAIPGGDDYILEAHTDSTFRMVDNSIVNTCMAIAMWSDEEDLSWTVEVSGGDRDFIIWDTSDANPANHIELGRVTNIMQRSIRELVHEINKLNLKVRATSLVSYPSAELEVTADKKPITPIGAEPAVLESHLFAYYDSDVKIRLEPPLDLNDDEDWFASIITTPLRKIVDSGPLQDYILTYNVGEHTWQPFSQHFQGIDVLDEPAEYIEDNYIAARHGNILPESLRVLSLGQDITHTVLDMDPVSGTIRLSKSILDSDLIELRYAYREPNRTIIDYVNLNPRQMHLPDGYRLYFGFYILPSELRAPGGTVETFTPNIGYVVSTSIQELRQAVANLTDAVSSDPVHAILLGILQSNSQGELEQVNVLDTRSQGGGLREDVDLRTMFEDVPEARFYSDVGYWDGESYPGHGVVVVEIPSRILGNNDLPVVNPSDGGFVKTDGRQKKSSIRDRVNRHLTIGMYGIIDDNG